MKILFSFVVSLIAITLHAQPTTTIEGAVIDKEGMPVSFASVYLKRSPHVGVMADRYGKFKLMGVYDRDTLICTHVNHQPKMEEIAHNNYIIIKMDDKEPPSIIAFTNKSVKYKTRHVKAPVVKGVEDDPDVLFTTVEIPAEYIGGANALRKYFERSIDLPDSCTIEFFPGDELVTGLVHIAYTIDETGCAGRPVVIKGIHDDIDNAIIRRINNMPAWKPAIQNGRAVPNPQELKVYVIMQMRKPKH